MTAIGFSSMLYSQIFTSGLGKVHSKFKSGLNIQFGDSLLYIGTGNALSAFGMNIRSQDMEKLLVAVEVGEIVVNKGKCLRFYTIGGVLELLYDKSACVDLKIPSIKCTTDKIATTELYNYLSRLDLEDKIGLEPNDIVNKHLNLLINSDKNNIEINIGIIRFFAGRGLGLTPSGDDILLGFTLALNVFGEFTEWNQCMHLVIDQQLTTSISIEYTKALLNGYISANCSDMVLSLDMDNEDKIARIVSAVAAFGHTSGNDTLYGFLTGLEFLLGKPCKH